MYTAAYSRRGIGMKKEALKLQNVSHLTSPSAEGGGELARRKIKVEKRDLIDANTLKKSLNCIGAKGIEVPKIADFRTMHRK